MKTWKIFTILAILAIIAITFTFTACFSNWTGEESFSITIGGSANSRAVSWYESIGINNLTHTIIVSGNGPEQIVRDVKANETVYFTVAPGNWNISVVADLKGKKRAEGDNSVEIKPGKNEIVIIKMYPYYDIGENGPAGGFIFYTNPNYKSDGWRYLEAAPTGNISNGRESTFIWGSEYYEYDEPIQFVVGNTQDEIGTGKNNTKRIVDLIIEKNLEINGYAAYVASRPIYEFDDWFLPSIYELKEMYNNLHVSINFSTTEPYWSSSEGNDSEKKAQVLYFADIPSYGITAGESYSLVKYGNGYVRAIRQF